VDRVSSLWVSQAPPASREERWARPFHVAADGSGAGAARSVRYDGVPPTMTSPNAYEDVPDVELLALSGRGDRRAFAEIVTRHGPFALRVAARLIPDPQVAEDVVQDAMLQTWRQAGRFDPRRARFSTWLYRIVVNRCIDHCRRPRPEPLPVGFDAADPAAGADAAVEAAERQQAVLRALASLPVRQKAAITLVYYEGVPGSEAARILGLSTKALERLLARGRSTLRACLSVSQELET
jgi:RNA polymerase sigma-70 factor, ECF subfamily